MSNLSENSTVAEVSHNSTHVAPGKKGLSLSLPELGLEFGVEAQDLDLVDDLDLDDLALDSVGLGAVRRRRRRLPLAVRRKLSRLAKRRRRTATGRFAGLGAVRRRRRRLPLAVRRKLSRLAKRRRRTATGRFAGLGAVRRRRLSPATRRKLRRAAMRRKRTKEGRFAGLELLGLSGPDMMADIHDLGAIEDFGAVKVRRRLSPATRRKLRRAAMRRKRTKEGRFAGFDRLSSLSYEFSQVDVAGSVPVVGVFQWLATLPGLEALGGVVLAPIVSALIGKLFSMIGVTPGTLASISEGLASSILLWEFGRLVGSANIAKFGSFYIFGRIIEREVLSRLFSAVGLSGFLSDIVRIPDTAEIGRLGKIAVPEEAELVGDTQRIPDTAPIGQVLLPEVKRPDYAVNPLSNVGTVRLPDTSEIGQEEMEVVDEEALLGAEESELF